jgi:hypothetical protein
MPLYGPELSLQSTTKPPERSHVGFRAWITLITNWVDEPGYIFDAFLSDIDSEALGDFSFLKICSGVERLKRNFPSI